MPKYTATRILSPAEAADDGVVALAKQAAFKEAMQAATLSLHGEALPEDHSTDEALRPSDDGGLVIEQVVTLP